MHVTYLTTDKPKHINELLKPCNKHTYFALDENYTNIAINLANRN